MSVGSASSQTAPPQRGLLARHPLVFFIAYAVSWLVFVPLALSEDGVGLLPFSGPLGPQPTISVGVFLGPFLSAFIMTGVTA
jgi:hypothetical protein